MQSEQLPITTVETELLNLENSEKENHAKLKELQQMVRDRYSALEEDRIKKKALQIYQKATVQTPVPSLPPSEIKALVVKKVFYEGTMTWDQAIETYAISRASISHILNEERKRKQNAESNVLVEHPPQKRGRKSPLANGEILIYILDRFEKDSTLDYNRLHKDIEQKFMIQTSPTAIKDTIAVEWNTLTILEARTRFIGSLGGVFLRPLIYVDEKGWNLHIHKSKGHAVKGEPAKLTLVPKGKNITLIGGLTRIGIIHYRFVESLGEKKTRQ